MTRVDTSSSELRDGALALAAELAVAVAVVAWVTRRAFRAASAGRFAEAG